MARNYLVFIFFISLNAYAPVDLLTTGSVSELCVFNTTSKTSGILKSYYSGVRKSPSITNDPVFAEDAALPSILVSTNVANHFKIILSANDIFTTKPEAFSATLYEGVISIRLSSPTEVVTSAAVIIPNSIETALLDANTAYTITPRFFVHLQDITAENVLFPAGNYSHVATITCAVDESI